MVVDSDHHHHCQHQRQRPKKARYMSQWESLLYEKNASSTAGLSIEQLFDARRWQPQGKGLKTFEASSQQSPAVTFRLEHREGGSLAQHIGEERILLFRSDRKGAIAKIIFSSTPPPPPAAAAAAKDTDTSSSSSEESDSEQRMAQAKIHVLDVKDIYRGYDLGGLLFSEALLALKHRYLSAAEQQHHNPASVSSIRCHLDAEEDARRHNKLVGFYERLGCIVKPKTRPQFLNNNDGETYRKIAMFIDLTAPYSNSATAAAESVESQKGLLVGNPRGFLPVLLLGSRNKPGRLVSSSSSTTTTTSQHWLMVEDSHRRVQFRTTQGRYLTVDSQGRCREEGLPSSSAAAAAEDHLSKFQLLRVSDSDQQHVLSGDDEDADNDSSEEATTSTPSPSLTEKELWVLLSPHGTFLNLDPMSLNLEASATPAFWQANSDNLSLTCTSDTPTRRQHYRRAWIKQTVDYVQTAKDRYLRFELPRISIKEALNLVKGCPGFPFRVDPTSRGLSIRNLCFRTAEAARAAGHPDWIQFVALIHALGSAVNCIDNKTAIESEDDYDWTITSSSRVVGCASSIDATFAEFRGLNDNESDEQYRSPRGVYTSHCGLENVKLTWSGPEYLFNMLKHNEVDLPEEAFSVLRLFPLNDWHSKNLYENLANDDDQEIRPFVVDFDKLRRQARRACLESDELTTDECDRLWESHYAAIAAKFGADDILQW